MTDLSSDVEVADEYRSSLSDLKINSKPLITMLTMLADENRPHASVIVSVIEKHIQQATPNHRLPVMYLIDSIMKNVGQEYIKLFAHNIITTFSCVFEKVDEKTRKKLYELRHTWNEVFPKSKLYGLDVKIQSIDPAWPLATGSSTTSQAISKPNIHINPNMIKPGMVKGTSSLSSSAGAHKGQKDLEILKREEQLLELERQKLELEKKKILLEQSRHHKQDTKPAKVEVEKPPAKPMEDQSISSERRSEFLRSYKIKKKTQNKEEVQQVSTTIHVDPRRVHQVLPVVAATGPVATRDPRRANEASRDPRIPHDSSRDPRMSENSRVTRLPNENARDPRLSSENTVNSMKSTKQSDAQVTSSRDPRIAAKEREKDKLKDQRKTKKESPSKSKKEKDAKPVKIDSRSSRSAHREKEKEKEDKEEKKKEKDSSVSSSSNRSNTSHSKKTSDPSVIAEELESTASFKSSRKSKRRIYKARDDSPEEVTSPTSSGKRTRAERDSDSDDSDHYQANKPNPALYNKKARKPEVGSPTTTTTGDTDYRQFTSPPKRPATSTTDENVSPPKKDCIMDEESAEAEQGLGLFSKKDVDYRQLLPRPALLPTPVGPAFNMTDQDDRNPSSRDPTSRDPLVPINPPDNQDPAIARAKGELGPPGVGSPLTGPIDPRTRKPSFNSPHAASWEKFREKNPEFKEYQRQASTSETERRFSQEGEELEPPFFDGHQGFSGRGRNFRGRGRGHRGMGMAGNLGDGRRKLYEDDEDSPGSPGRGEAARQNYQVIVKQAEEQMRRGEINMSQYNQLLTTVVTLVEQDKIREARSRDRRQHRTSPHFPGDGDWTGPSENPIPGPNSVPPNSASGPSQGPGPLPGPGPGLGPGRGRGMRESHMRGSRGGYMGPSGPPTRGNLGGGMGRGIPGGRGGPPGGPESEDGWGRGGMRGRGRRGRGGYILDDRNWGHREGNLEDEWTGEPDLPFVTEERLKAVARDAETRTIDIDGVPREIRTYGNTAVILLDWDDPRILTFGEGHCNIVFDEGQFVLPMRIGEDYKEFTIAGETHRVKLGVPTKELMLDGRGYQCFFGGKPITVHLAGQPRTVRLDGKPPNVNIGPSKNTEYVAGKIQLVIHARKVIPLYLDAKPQRFNIDGRPFIIKFVDALRAVTINDIRFPVEFGGLPISISVRGYRRFLRFTALPTGIIPGQVNIRGMEKEGQKHSGISGSPAQEQFSGEDRNKGPSRRSPPHDVSRKSLPSFPEKPKGGAHSTLGQDGVFLPQGPPLSQRPMQGPTQGLPQGPPPPGPPPQLGPNSGVLPVSNVNNQTAPPSIASLNDILNHPPPQVGVPPNNIPGSYMTTQLPPASAKTSEATPQAPLDLNSLLENLARTGLISAKVQDKSKTKKEEEQKKQEEEDEKEKEEDELVPVEFMFNSENLRKRRKWLIEVIYRGMQCSSCGLRYPPEQTLQYSHHLDWHFRQNRRQQESTKKANTRKFYFSIQDWLQYEEIEDVEERVPSMFENEGVVETMESEETEEPSVAVSSDLSLGVCPTCHDTFSQFFHQETEEWRYRNALQVDGINYHPACHQDTLRAEAAEREAEEKLKEMEKMEENKKDDNETEDSSANAEEKDKKMDDDLPVDSQPAVREKQEELSILPELPIRIKEEPLDVEEYDVEIFNTPSFPMDFQIKQEVKKEPEEHDEEDLNEREPEEDDENSILRNESTEEPMWETPAVSVNAAETDIASSIDGNTELTTPEATGVVTKIKFNVSKPTLNINNNINNENKKDDANDTLNSSMNDEIDEFVPPPFTVDYDLKPGFRGAELTEQPLEARGIEISGLCSIM